MKRPKKVFSNDEKRKILAEAAAGGATIAAITKKYKIGESTFYNWKASQSQLAKSSEPRAPKSQRKPKGAPKAVGGRAALTSQAGRSLQSLELENAQLKLLLAEAQLEKYRSNVSRN